MQNGLVGGLNWHHIVNMRTAGWHVMSKDLTSFLFFLSEACTCDNIQEVEALII
jgi:hypothetical protein